MSIRARLPLFVVRDIVTAPGSGYNSTERLVALCIADHMGDTGSAWPARRAIEQWTGLGHSAVSSALRKLCGDGALFALQQGGARPGNRYDSNIYTLKSAAELSATRTPPSCPPGGSYPLGGHELSATRTRAVRQAASQGLNEGLIEGPNVKSFETLVVQLTDASSPEKAMRARR